MDALTISPGIAIPIDEVDLSAVRAQGAGGQNVNKVSSAIHLRFDIPGSSLPPAIKERLLALRDSRISREGVVVIKAQRFRTQEKNRSDALTRLQTLVSSVTTVPRPRRPTRPSRSSQKKRMDSKTRRGQVKSLRGKVDH